MITGSRVERFAVLAVITGFAIGAAAVSGLKLANAWLCREPPPA